MSVKDTETLKTSGLTTLPPSSGYLERRSGRPNGRGLLFVCISALSACGIGDREGKVGRRH